MGDYQRGVPGKPGQGTGSKAEGGAPSVKLDPDAAGEAIARSPEQGGPTPNIETTPPTGSESPATVELRPPTSLQERGDVLKSEWHSSFIPDDTEGLGKYIRSVKKQMSEIRRVFVNQMRQPDGRRVAESSSVREIRKFGRAGFVVGAPVTENTEIVVVGDLHGCYVNARAVLAQTDAVRKLRGGQDFYLVFVGDIFDRGNGVMHGLLPLLLTLIHDYPQRVIWIRGDHEHLVRNDASKEGDLDWVGAVSPADTLENWQSMRRIASPFGKEREERVIPSSFWNSLSEFFQLLPNIAFFSNGVVVSHAGIPWTTDFPNVVRIGHISEPDYVKTETRERIAYYNRLSLMWTDPGSEPTYNAGTVEKPILDVHSQFGYEDFAMFRERFQLGVLVRGHQHAEDGVEEHYDGQIITVCSAGGTDTQGRVNPQINHQYRYAMGRVTPRFLRIHRGIRVAEEIDWSTYLEEISVPDGDGGQTTYYS
jgi:hypothetical protein